ncbi:HNH endonuclease [Massilia oculi]|uniref:HNH endonuclease n=2 Tax=Massilia oculi TaxID=945844 RepID=A0A2S2DQB2_9BURK|nr:HNH endonuclease [Massilia oculi]
MLLHKSNYAFKPYQLNASNPLSVHAKQEVRSDAVSGIDVVSTKSLRTLLQSTNRRYWWVNQNQTYKTEVPGGFLWSPKTRADGVRNQFYDNMMDVNIGDVVFSFCDTRIKAIGVAIGKAETSTKPDFGDAGASWAKDGWLVPVEFKELHSQIRPKDHIEAIRAHLPAKYSPLQESGDGLQSVYLAAVPASMADVLATLIGKEFTLTLKALQGELDESEIAADQQEEAIRGRTDIGATTKTQLVNARRGQGVFKANVRLNEKGCRITGVTDPLHLRASHIKPWKDSSDDEKLNGCNGLLLAPHIDHLFDRGLISFSSDGRLLISKQLDQMILAKWGIPEVKYVGTFNSDQIEFLRYHEQSVFKR